MPAYNYINPAFEAFVMIYYVMLIISLLDSTKHSSYQSCTYVS